MLAYLTLYKPTLFLNSRLRLDGWLNLIFCAEELEVKDSTLSSVQSLLSLLFIVMGMMVITKENAFPGWWAVLPTMGAVLIISAGLGAWFNRVVLANRVLVWFGLISFPLYLWHWPLLAFARIMEGDKPVQNIRIAAVIIAVVLAWLTYKFIEKPLRFKQTDTELFANLIDTLCNQDGCLTYIGDDKKTGITFLDGAHLTPIASDYVAKNLLVNLIVGDNARNQ
jgi:peptidoglycan/LPS O-acetylase OafA/YrhL